MTTYSFTEQVEEITSGFLQTAVLVDDRSFMPSIANPASTGRDDEADPSEVVEKLDTPEGEDGGAAEVDVAHDLNAKAVIDAFADHGLVCGVIDPQRGEEITVVNRVATVAQRADLLILDWFLLGQAGTITLDILAATLNEGDGDTKRRMRLVAIYTGERRLEAIMPRIKKQLADHYQDCAVVQHDDYTIDKGPVRIVVLAKPHAPEAPELQRVAFEDIPARLTKDFASFTRGVVRGVGLAALSALRRDTHRLLHVLGANLDLGYMAERARLPRPVEAEERLLEIVVGEMRSILEDNHVTRVAEIQSLGAWIDETLKKAKLGEGLSSEGLDAAALKVLLEQGIPFGHDEAIAIDRDMGKRNKVQKEAASAFAVPSEDPELADAVFAARTLTRTRYGHPPMQLTLGAIVRRPTTNASWEYMLCMQPECDSVGVTKTTTFPFLPLREVTIDEYVDYVVKAPEGGYIRLSLEVSPGAVFQLGFEPGPEEQVLAASEGERALFSPHWDTSSGEKSQKENDLEWVCQLRPAFAQNAAHRLGEKFSRVAVDKPESLRLLKK